jgi:hypothetical protein
MGKATLTRMESVWIERRVKMFLMGSVLECGTTGGNIHILVDAVP